MDERSGREEREEWEEHLLATPRHEPAASLASTLPSPEPLEREERRKRGGEGGEGREEGGGRRGEGGEEREE